MTKIKICGLRREEDISFANELRPDYVGFVFAPSRRQVSPRQAAALREQLNPAIPAVGVFVNEQVDAVAELLRQEVIQLAQLHGDEDGGYLHLLRTLVPGAVIIRAVQVGRALPDIPQGVDFPLFDADSKTLRGGTGQSFDWSLLHGYQQPFFLAGGIHSGNAAEAIRQLRPYCLDASSGVEADGCKDYDKMKSLIDTVRRSQQ